MKKHRQADEGRECHFPRVWGRPGGRLARAARAMGGSPRGEQQSSELSKQVRAGSEAPGGRLGMTSRACTREHGQQCLGIREPTGLRMRRAKRAEHINKNSSTSARKLISLSAYEHRPL